MSTPAQQQASRTNGQKSHGPITEEGKKIAAQNATKHGLASTDPNPETLLLAHEDPALLAQMQTDYYRRYTPTDTVERDLVDRIIAAQWRIKRARLMETLTLESDRFAEDPETGEITDLGFAYALKQNFQDWKSVQRYEARQARETARCLKELRQLRTEADPQEDNDQQEAELLAYLMAPLPNEPGYSGPPPRPDFLKPDPLLSEIKEKNRTNPGTPIFHADHIKKPFASPYPKPKH